MYAVECQKPIVISLVRLSEGIESLYKINPLIEYYEVYMYLPASLCSSAEEFAVVPI